MKIFKRASTLISYYILGIIIANLAAGTMHLLLKISLVTVQGPTLFSQVLSVLAYYIALCIASFLLFKLLRKKRPQIKYREVFLYGAFALCHFFLRGMEHYWLS